MFLVAPSAKKVGLQRQFDPEALEQFKGDPEFDYSVEYAQSGSFLTLFIAYILNKIFSLIDVSGVAWIAPWIFRLLLVLLIVYVIYFILKSRYGPLFTRESKSHVPSGIVSHAEENVDFEKLIQQSVLNSEYRMAIRYLFLNSLKRLHDRGDIEIRQWKAPYDYLKEIPGEKRSFFRELIDLFEVTWYGEYSADEEAYNKGLTASKQLVQ